MSYFSKSGITYARYLGTRRDISASTTAAITSAGISPQVNLVCIHNLAADTAFVLVEDDAVASVTTSNGFPIAAGQFHYFEVTPGQRVSAILTTGAGTVAVCEMGK